MGISKNSENAFLPCVVNFIQLTMQASMCLVTIIEQQALKADMLQHKWRMPGLSFLQPQILYWDAATDPRRESQASKTWSGHSPSSV